jgi:signal transduction histidine kinase
MVYFTTESYAFTETQEQAAMLFTILDKLKLISPWHFIWISVVFSEVITFFLSTVQGRIWWGGVSRETLIIGAVDALVVPLIVASVVIYFVKHITELQKINEQLQEANQRLREIDKMKSDFVTVASHELRTPLTTIKAFIELLVMKPGMPGQRREKLATAINVETDRLSRLIASLLDLSRIEAGLMQLRREEVSIEDIIQSSLASVSAILESKALRVTTAFNRPLSRISGDRDRLVQVISNILSNAGKYTPAEGSIQISVREEPAPSPQMIVEVSDTGVGIPAEDLERIFEKFWRSGSDLAEIEGTGLGLAIARGIVNDHGGSIRATSTLGKGSTFTVTLPLNRLS